MCPGSRSSTILKQVYADSSSRLGQTILRDILRMNDLWFWEDAMKLERIATNTYDFETIRRTGLTYVDKTGLLYPLVNGSMGNQFFLSRPRRFGKSLLVSTIQKLFEGRRDLFEGLAIDSLPWDWSKAYPVLRLDMSLCSGETVGGG